MQLKLLESRESAGEDSCYHPEAAWQGPSPKASGSSRGPQMPHLVAVSLGCVLELPGTLHRALTPERRIPWVWAVIWARWASKPPQGLLT